MTARANLVVAVDARPLLAAKTGVETYLGHLVEHLLDDERISLRLLMDRPGAAGPWDPARCRVATVPRRNAIPRAVGDGWIVSDVRRQLAAERADVFFTSSAKFPPGPTPTVVTVHDLGWRRMPAAYTRSERLRQRLWTGWAALRATRLVAVSQFTRSELTQWMPRCAPRVRVIHEAAALGWRRIEDAAQLQRARSGLGVAGPFVLAVGTLSPKKQLETLFAAFERLAASGFADHQLVVAGKVGWKAESILRAARRNPRIHLAGYVDDATLLALYSAASLYVSACPCEGFGLPVLEAMACETPVVAANAGALPEVAGDAAVLCESSAPALAAAMARVIADRELQATLVARGKLRVRSFSWARAASELAAVLREAAGAAA